MISYDKLLISTIIRLLLSNNRW